MLTYLYLDLANYLSSAKPGSAAEGTLLNLGKEQAATAKLYHGILGTAYSLFKLAPFATIFNSKHPNYLFAYAYNSGVFQNLVAYAMAKVDGAGIASSLNSFVQEDVQYLSQGKAIFNDVAHTEAQLRGNAREAMNTVEEAKHLIGYDGYDQARRAAQDLSGIAKSISGNRARLARLLEISRRTAGGDEKANAEISESFDNISALLKSANSASERVNAGLQSANNAYLKEKLPGIIKQLRERYEFNFGGVDIEALLRDNKVSEAYDAYKKSVDSVEGQKKILLVDICNTSHFTHQITGFAFCYICFFR